MKYFFARQPVFNKFLEVHAYDLVFRSGFEGAFHDEQDPAKVSSSFLNLGLSTLTGGRKAIIQFPQQLIIEEIPKLFRPEEVYVSVGDSDNLDDQCVGRLEELRDAGYSLLFDTRALYQPQVLGLASTLHVDFSQTTVEERKTIANLADSHDIRLLAANVDTWRVYREVLDLHFDYFHGFFFAMPELVSGQEVPGLKVTYLDLIAEIHRPELDLGRISEIVKKDVSLTFRLLKFINSSAFGIRRKVESVHHALVLMGDKEIRRWLTLVSLGGIATDRPDEMLLQLLVRARFCESLAQDLSLTGREMDLYMLGMFSSLDAVLDTEMEQVLEQVTLSDDVRAALRGEDGTLRKLLDLVLAYERGQWERVHQLADALVLQEDMLPDRYQDSLVWATSAFEERELVNG